MGEASEAPGQPPGELTMQGCINPAAAAQAYAATVAATAVAAATKVHRARAGNTPLFYPIHTLHSWHFPPPCPRRLLCLCVLQFLTKNNYEPTPNWLHFGAVQFL